MAVGTTCMVALSQPCGEMASAREEAPAIAKEQAAGKRCEIGDENKKTSMGFIFFPGHGLIEQVPAPFPDRVENRHGAGTPEQTDCGCAREPLEYRDRAENEEMKDLACVACSDAALFQLPGKPEGGKRPHDAQWSAQYERVPGGKVLNKELQNFFCYEMHHNLPGKYPSP